MAIVDGLRIVYEDGWVKISRELSPGAVWLTPVEWDWLRAQLPVTEVDDGMCKKADCPNFGGIWHDCPQYAR